MTTTTPESPQMIDLRRQLREASTAGAARQVMANTMVAIRANEISGTESMVLNKEFVKINKKLRARLKELRAELEPMKH